MEFSSSFMMTSVLPTPPPPPPTPTGAAAAAAADATPSRPPSPPPPPPPPPPQQKLISFYQVNPRYEATINNLMDQNRSNWIYNYNALYNYKNKVSFSIKPKECVIILPKSYALTNEMTFEIQYCVNDNQLKLCDDVSYLCIYIMNSDNQVELYVDEGTSLGALLEQSEIDYSLCHIPFGNLETYLNNQSTNCDSSSSSISSSIISSSSSSDDYPAQTLPQDKKDSETNQFDDIANACINAANAAATAAATAAAIIKSFAHNK
jgi:hypothetical protein